MVGLVVTGVGVDLWADSGYPAGCLWPDLVLLLVALITGGVVVKRRDLWAGVRRRAGVVRSWSNGVRWDQAYDRRRGWRLISWAVMEVVRGVRRASKPREADVPKKPDQSVVVPGTVEQAARVPKVLERTPVLASYLLDLSYEDGGGAREPSYLIVKAAGGEWLVTLKDPTECRQLRVRVSDLGTAYAQLEALLTAGVCPWERDQWAEDRKPKKRR